MTTKHEAEATILLRECAYVLEALTSVKGTRNELILRKIRAGTSPHETKSILANDQAKKVRAFLGE